MRTLLISAALTIGTSAWAADIWVDPASSAANPDGTAASAYKTIAAAAAKAVAGDSIVLKGGIYRGAVNQLPSGNAGSPVTLKSAPGERAVLSGASVVTEWTDTGNGVFTATIDAEPARVLLDGRELAVSRQPNEGWWTASEVAENSLVDGVSLKRTPASLESMAAYIWTQKGNNFHTVPVRSIDNQTGRLTLAEGKRPLALSANDKYYLRNHPEFVDLAGEWASVKRPDGKVVLYMRPGDPADLKRVEVILGTDSVIGIRDAKHLVIDGIEITGAGRNGIDINESSDITIQDCVFHNNEFAGVAARDVDRITVRRSLVEENEYGVLIHTGRNVTVEETEVGRNGTDGVVFSWNSEKVTLQRSYVHDHLLWGHPDNVQMYRNVKNYKLIDNLIAVSGQSLMMEETEAGEIRGNMFVGSEAYMLIFGHRNANDCDLIGNTFAFAGYGCINFTGSNYRVKENIFVTGHGRPAFATRGVVGYVGDRNLFWNAKSVADGRPVGSDAGQHRSLDDFKAATGQDSNSIQADPMFRSAPSSYNVLDGKQLSQSTRSLLVIRRGGAPFEVGDHVEVNFDGIVRRVTDAHDDSITIDPPLGEKPTKPWVVANWGQAKDFKLDLRLREESPAGKLAEGGNPAGSLIDIAAYRRGDFDGDGTRDIPERLRAN